MKSWRLAQGYTTPPPANLNPQSLTTFGTLQSYSPFSECILAICADLDEKHSDHGLQRLLYYGNNLESQRHQVEIS